MKVTVAMLRILTGPPAKRAVQREAFQSLANALAAGGQSAHHSHAFHMLPVMWRSWQAVETPIDAGVAAADHGRIVG
ncbi:hypothetical protein [Xanthomonas fragariae]|uniref:hypothetical protein n=1 Tax=Xanthomonas fragariae TaxID=48664 RepID=UPI0022AA1E8C|nr:hypothetical protein [Xanthomonas fragariae]WAT16674.1 hypothetical protein OZ429_03340 [Xanthomonas fragariae]